jgi:flagellar hook-basal body complex protein FliE
MLPPISSISPPAGPQLSAASPTAAGRPSFQDALSAAIQHVDAAGTTADAAAQDFISGTGSELHSTILAAQNAELDFDLFMQVRNKVVSAYEEIMKMQL